MAKPDVGRLIEFHRLLNEFAQIERVIHLKRHGKSELESDTEHSFNLAMTAWFIAEYFPELDKGKVIQLALVHDLVEVHAGDTFAFAEQAQLDSKAEREAAAQKQLTTEWPDFKGMHKAIAEYETRHTPEARFVYAMDKIMPVLTIYLNEGLTWHEKQISLERLHKEKMAKMTAFPEVLVYWEELYELLRNSPELFPTT
jgi:putative hydrolase of HD superfamily